MVFQVIKTRNAWETLKGKRSLSGHDENAIWYFG